jgi:hypothetical protein
MSSIVQVIYYHELSIMSLIYFPNLLQCFIFGMVHVKPGDKFCHNWPKSSGKSVEVSLICNT